MQTEEEVGPLDAVDQAVLDRILELFSTPYPQLTRPQVLMLETIVAATKEAQVPFSHIFQPDDILYDGMMIKIIKNVVMINWVNNFYRYDGHRR